MMISPEKMIWSDAAVYNNDGKEWKIVSQAWEMQPEGLISCTEAELLCRTVVKAVNSHDALVKALEAIAEFCSGDMTSLGSIARLASIQNEARNALASIKVPS